MANKKFWLGILVLALVFGMMVIGCGGEDDDPSPQPEPQQPQPGNSVDNPINRTESIDLGTMTEGNSGWQQLLNSIKSNAKYVNLDLSACTMTGTSFNPDASVFDGKYYIVSLILPNVATSIAETSDSFGVFKSFSNLNSINGANITTIGKDAFSVPNLKSVSFPEVTTIGSGAFSVCSELTTLNFPEVETIGSSAFLGCSGLTTLDIPKVTSIGGRAFHGTGSTALTITMGAAAPQLGQLIFVNVTEAKTVKVKVPSGASGYTPFTGTSVTISGENTTENWANGFRGGSNNSIFSSDYINKNISLTIEPK